MKTYFLVCKKLTDSPNSKTVKNKRRLMMKSIYPVCGKIYIYLFHKDLVCSIV